MPPSQLKQLKASLHEHGVVGPQKSKKQRKANAKDAQKRLQRTAALEHIRERFNPFEVRAPARREKYEVISNKDTKKPAGRPGVTRGLGEERRKETLLRELQNRKKVGGLVDRRFGENDPTLTPEERAAERFARQSERKSRKNVLFNLEEDSGDEMMLTHGGQSLGFDGDARDDYEQEKSDEEDPSDFEEQEERPRKRVRLDDENEDEQESGKEEPQPERKKSKKEVMEEIIAKSKMHKVERRLAKEDDEDLRMELDQGMSEMYQAIRSHKPIQKPLPTPPSDSEPQMDPARAAMLAGQTREDAEKEYEANLRQMRMDARSKPSVRTKPEDERAAEEAERLQELERRRVRRMKGEMDSSEDEEADEPALAEDEEQDDAQAFGLAQPSTTTTRLDMDVEGEDDFVLDDLVASGSELEMATDEESEEQSVSEDDGDDDFINGLALPNGTSEAITPKARASKDLAFTFPCPQTHAELLELLEDKQDSDLPTIVQRIRALYHKGLAEDNQDKVGNFAHVLVEHIAYMVDEQEEVSFDVIENLLRHLHSMAKARSSDISSAIREHLSKISEQRPLHLTAGDCILLTGISTIFPTSDLYHPVATPAILTIARYLGQSTPQSLQELCIGLFCCSLAFQYQEMARRYVPEVINYVVNAIAILSPTPLSESTETDGGKLHPLNVHIRLPDNSLRIIAQKQTAPKKLSFSSLLNNHSETSSTSAVDVLNTTIALCVSVSALWSSHSAYPEMVTPLIHALTHISSPAHKTHLPPSLLTHASSTLARLTTSLTASLAERKPLLLHNHRPRAIKSSIPAFIDNYNPDRHYDPDRQRAELSKLKSEHKKERKGAMRELRKDANFVAREQLKEKREKDEAYEKKMRRLVGEIQAEEGQEKRGYEREKAKRTRKGR